jgi:hypothetical protein
MGILNHLLVAHASEAEAIVACDDPSRTWDGFFYRGLDRIKLATLWALVESGSVNDRLDERLDQIHTIPEGDEGPWVDIIPTRMLFALASIAAMEESKQTTIAEKWSRTEELEGSDPSEVFDLVRSIGDTAETAQLEDKTLLIWTSL